MRAEVAAAVDSVNAERASYETIKGFVILDTDFSLETGELTPSQKVRRTVVANRYERLLNKFYAG